MKRLGQPATTVAHGQLRILQSLRWVSFGFAFCLFASAQTVVPPPAAADAQTNPSPDTLGRTTPRGTVLGFLKNARKGDYDAATEYLNTKLRGEAATDLAHELFVIIDHPCPPVSTS